MQLSVQGYLQQRKRLNPEILPYLNRKYLMDFYNSDEPGLWKGYLLIAIDGSKAEVPNSKENRETFGNSGNQHSKTGQVRALVSGMYDVMNHLEGIHYLVRLLFNDYTAERKQMRSADETVILKHSSARLQKIRKKHPERYEHMKRKNDRKNFKVNTSFRE